MCVCVCVCHICRRNTHNGSFPYAGERVAAAPSRITTSAQLLALAGELDFVPVSARLALARRLCQRRAPQTSHTALVYAQARVAARANAWRAWAVAGARRRVERGVRSARRCRVGWRGRSRSPSSSPAWITRTFARAFTSGCASRRVAGRRQMDVRAARRGGRSGDIVSELPSSLATEIVGNVTAAWMSVLGCGLRAQPAVDQASARAPRRRLRAAA